MRGNRHVTRIKRRPSFNIEDRIVSNLSFERNIRRCAGRQDARQIFDAIKDLIGKGNPLPVLRVFGLRQDHLHRQQMVWLEAQIDVLKTIEGL